MKRIEHAVSRNQFSLTSRFERLGNFLKLAWVCHQPRCLDSQIRTDSGGTIQLVASLYMCAVRLVGLWQRLSVGTVVKLQVAFDSIGNSYGTTMARSEVAVEGPGKLMKII